MIVGLSVVRDERELIAQTVRHLLAHGVARLLLVDHRSTDGTSDILSDLARETGALDVERKDDPYFRQHEWQNELLWRASKLAPTWILPFDADETWLPMTRATIAEELYTLPAPAFAPALVWQHASLTSRARVPLMMRKLAFTWEANLPQFALDVGGHHVRGHGGVPCPGRLEVRERAYLSEAHFIDKTRKHNGAHYPGKPDNQSLHHKRRAGMTDAELAREYAVWKAQCSEVEDPMRLAGRLPYTAPTLQKLSPEDPKAERMKLSLSPSK